MAESVWTRTLEEFRQAVDSGESLPAGVFISAVSAASALALIAKVLDIAGRRKNFSDQNKQRAAALRDTARAESASLTRLADDDLLAFNSYIEAVRSREDQAISGAVRIIIDVPMNGARAAVRGLELCVEAAEMIRGSIAADLGIAAALLAGSVRGMLISVDSNLKNAGQDERIVAAISAERQELEKKAIRLEEVVGRLLKAPK